MKVIWELARIDSARLEQIPIVFYATLVVTQTHAQMIQVA